MPLVGEMANVEFSKESQEAWRKLGEAINELLLEAADAMMKAGANATQIAESLHTTVGDLDNRRENKLRSQFPKRGR